MINYAAGESRTDCEYGRKRQLLLPTFLATRQCFVARFLHKPIVDRSRMNVDFNSFFTCTKVDKKIKKPLMDWNLGKY